MFCSFCGRKLSALDDAGPDKAVKGRGAVSNEAGRYEPYQRVRTADGWEGAWDRDAPEPRADTLISPDASREIIATNQSPDIPFDRSINPYRGCEHGCIYCYARPSHAWLGLSPGRDFETRIFAKHEAPALLRKALSKRGYKPKVIALGANTDPYQPAERKLEITRGVLEVLRQARHPVTIVTKSALILRDLDILAPLAEAGLVRVMVSVTTLDGALARKLEPRAPRPERRLAAIEGLNKAGVPAGVLAAPMIPALNDAEMEKILEAAAGAGARSAGYTVLRLPLEIKDLFREWLDAHFPDRRDRVFSLVRQTRGGKLYDADFKHRMRGHGVYAEMIAKRFQIARKRLGLDKNEWQPDTSQFVAPGPDPNQLALF